MLNLLNSSTDKLQLTTGSAATIDVHASWVDLNGSTVTPGRTNTAISSVTTADIVATPGASTTRNVKTLHIRNKDSSLSCDVTVIYDANGTDYELYKVTLGVGEMAEYVEGIGFFKIPTTAALDATRFVSADVTNATTSFADITDLTVPLKSGVHYNFLTYLYHQTNATTTGAQFGVNIGATPTGMILGGLAQITASVTAATFGASAAVTAVDTAAIVETTGPGANNFIAILSGWIQPSADGTFAVRSKSEVAVAGGLVIKKGSWLRVWQSVQG